MLRLNPTIPARRLPAQLRWLCACAAFCGGAGAILWAAEPRIAQLTLVPTFECIGVYAHVEDASLDQLQPQLEFRESREDPWQPALDPVAYAPDAEIRGSIFHLKADTDYEVRLRLNRADTVVAEGHAVTRTWNENVPIAREVIVSPQPGVPLVIRDQGSPTGWIRYRPLPGTVLDVGTRAPNAVVLEQAAFVIVEGMTIRGGTEHAVHVVDSHDIRVRGCDIAGWGNPGVWRNSEKKKQWAYLDAAGEVIDRQAGIRVRGAGAQRVVLERNLIHHPRGTAASWAFQHPHGPSGIVLSETGGNHVVRYNDLIAGDGHRWNDTIESEFNPSVNGGPHRDSDLYGNLLVGANDDGTELDGGQMNVRYWHNRIEGGLCGVSCAPNLRGPSYVFRNIIVLGDERGAVGAGFKMGGDRFPNPGVSFLLHNTVYSQNYGLTSGHYGKGPTPIFSRNNIFTGPGPGQGRVRFDAAVAGDLDHDLIPADGLLGTPEPKRGREAAAIFDAPHFVSAEQRDFRLQRGSAGTGAGVPLANMSRRDGPDMGAIDSLDRVNTWPVRPTAPEIWPGKTVIRLRAGTHRTCVVTVSTREAWRAIEGETWMTCEPREGGPADRSGVTCRIDATALAVGTHRTFVGIRTARGELRSIPVEVEVEPALTVQRTFEPEEAPANPAFSVERGAGAKGGAWVRTVSAPKSGGLLFDFEVPQAGDYYVLARARAAGPVARIADQDSLHLALDDGKSATWDLFGLAMTKWTWVVARPKEAVDGRFALTAGRHRLILTAREHDLEIDQLIVSNSPFAPRSD